MVICPRCKSGEYYIHAKGKRKVITLSGEIEVGYINRLCKKCKRSFRSECEEAPFWGKWGWDVIEKVVKLNIPYSKIRLLFKKKYGINLAESSICYLKTRYGLR